MKKIEGAMRRAIQEFNMIESGDCIAVGISGGKDSLALLSGLASLRRYLPQSFQIKAITIDMGFEGFATADIAAYCKQLDVEYAVAKTDIASIVFDHRKEKNPCSLCAKMRRGALNHWAVEHGCNKVALGHHFDDVIETFFLSLFYEGRLSCFDAICFLDRMGVTVIRPLIYVEERDIASYAKKAALPVTKSLCPADGNTKREQIKQLLSSLDRQYDDLRQHIFGAVKNGLLLKNAAPYLAKEQNPQRN
jgi:tRNA 2-thiocytidine biosynthesis protein TtcA